MSVSTPPSSRDVLDFQFKLSKCLKVFSSSDYSVTGSVNLVATASKYGLIFVGCPTGFKVVSSPSLEILDSGGTTVETAHYPSRSIDLGCMPTHLAVSSDHTHLAVAVQRDSCAHAVIYYVPSFASLNIQVVQEIRLSSTPNTKVHEILWNPGIPEVLATCISDGSLIVNELKPNSIVTNSLPCEAQSTCFSWSPKGKQLVVGDKSGALTQYRPDLKAVKKMAAPDINGSQVFVINVLWLSNYQFAAIYKDKNNSERPGLFIVNAPKVGDVAFINYEDICYSAGECRDPQFYLIHLPVWNVLIVASANSMEVGVLGLQQDQVTWEQWVQEDSGRAELPLTSNKEETYPVGFSFDTSTQHQLLWKENQMLPPPPVLQILSNRGILCLFHVVNLIPNAPSLCSPPEMLQDQSGFAQFVISSPQKEAIPNTLNSSQSLSQGTPGLSVNSGGVASVTSSNFTPPLTTEGARKNLTPKFETLGQPSSSIFGASPGNAFQNLGPGIGILPMSASTTTPSSTNIPSINPVLSQQGAALPSFGFGSTKPFIPAVSTSANTFGFGAVPALNPTPFTFATPITASTPVQVSKPVAQTSTSGSLASYLSNTTVASKTSTKVEHTPSVILKAPPIQITSSNPVSPPPAAAVGAASGLNENQEEAVAALNDSVYLNAIKEEMISFQAEIDNLTASVKAIDYQIGTKEQMSTLREVPETMLEFWQELKELTAVQNSEIYELKTLLLETFAWVEDARSRHELHSNPRYIEATRTRGLDPISSRYAASIREQLYYVETQLRDVNKTLDTMYIRFLNSKKDRIKRKLQIPTLDAVYKTIVLHFSILQQKRQLFHKLLLRLPATKRSHVVLDTDLNKTASATNMELSTLADSLLKMHVDESKELAMKSKAVLIPRQLDKKQLSKLREVLINRPVVRICPTKPASINMPLMSTRETSQHYKIKSLEKYNFPLSSPKSGGITSGTPVVTKGDISNISNKKSSDVLSKPTVANTNAQNSSLFVFGPLSSTAEEKKKDMPSSIESRKPAIENKENAFPLSSFSSGSLNKENTFPATSSNTVNKANVAKNLFPRLGSNITIQPVNKNTMGKKKEDFSFPAPEQSLSNTSLTTSGSNIFKSQVQGSTSLKDEKLTFQSEKFKDASDFLAAQVLSSISSVPPAVDSGSQKNPLISLGNIVASIGENDNKIGKPLEKSETKIPSCKSIAAVTTEAAPKPVDTFKFSFGTPLLPTTSVPHASISSFNVLTSVQSDTSKSPPFTSFSSLSHTQGTKSNAVTSGTGEKKQSCSDNVPSSTVSSTGQVLPKWTQEVDENIPVIVSVVSLPDKSTSGDIKPKAASPLEETSQNQAIKNKNVETSASAVGSSVSGTTPLSTSFFGTLSSGATSRESSMPNSIFGTNSGIEKPSSGFNFGLAFSNQMKSKSNDFQEKIAGSSSSSATASSSSLEKPLTNESETLTAAEELPKLSIHDKLESTVKQQESQPSPFGSLSASSSSIFGGSSSSGLSISTATSIAKTSVTTSTVTGTTTSSAPFSFKLPSSTSSFSFSTTDLLSQSTTVATTTSDSTIFGQQICSPSSFGDSTGNIFGKAAAAIFGQASSQTSPFAQTTTTSGSFFGQTSSTSTAPFGQAPTTTSQTFGQLSSPFGQSSTSASTLTFGQTPTSTIASSPAFGQSSAGTFGSSPSSFFGSGTNAFGNKSLFEQSGSSVFGQSSTNAFGSSSGSIFGGNTSSSGFGGNTASSPTGNPFQSSSGAGGGFFGSTGGPFSSATGQSVAQSGFGGGSLFQQNKPAGFGTSSPSFSFGSPPAFGANPTFGGAPTFGTSPTKLFGSSNDNTGFGTVSPQHSSTFENLASQNTPTFGNIAQNQGQPGFGTQSMFGGSSTSGSAFSGGGSSGFGGSSFSSWR